METALVSLICIAMLIVGVVTLTFNAFESVTTVADSLREIEQRSTEIRLTEIGASQWDNTDTVLHAVAYVGDGDDGYLKTVDIASTGQITDTVADTLEFDTLQGQTPHMVHISGDIYAIAYTGDADSGLLKTVEIATDGQITDTVVDSLEFDGASGLNPDIIHVTGEVYAIAYAGNGGVGMLKTVEIATDGQIADAVVDTLEFDGVQGVTPSIIHISNDIYAIAYSGDADSGLLKTVEIAANGQITDAVVDTLEFDGVQGVTPGIIHISGDVYAIAYSGGGDDGYLATVGIATNGQITDTVLDSLEFDILIGMTPSIIQVSGGIYAIAYTGSGGDGHVTTVEIATDGQITDAVVDSLEFDGASGLDPDIIHVTGEVYAIAYTKSSDEGYVTTIEIATDGQIADAVVDLMEFDAVYGVNPVMVLVQGNIELAVFNNGQANLAQFSKWDVIVQYQDGSAAYMEYTTEAAPGDDQWTVAGLFLPDNSVEVFDPDILNPGEKMRLILNTGRAISEGETVRITISTPNGVTAQSLVTR